MLYLVNKVTSAVRVRMSNHPISKGHDDNPTPVEKKSTPHSLAIIMGSASSAPVADQYEVSLVPPNEQGIIIGSDFLEQPRRTITQWNNTVVGGLESMVGMRLNRVPDSAATPGFPLGKTCGEGSATVYPNTTSSLSQTSVLPGSLTGLINSKLAASPMVMSQLDDTVPPLSNEKQKQRVDLVDLSEAHNRKTADYVPEGYPDPVFIYDSIVTSNLLSNIGELMMLSIYKPSLITNAGVYTVKTGYNATDLLVSDQLKLNTAGHYYSSMPQVSYTSRVFKLVHFMAALDPSRSTSPSDYAEIKMPIAIIKDQQITTIVKKMGEIMLKAEAREVSDLSTVMSISECVMIIEDLRINWPILFNVYKMLYNLCHGGFACIAPIPEMVRDNPVLTSYVDIIARGNGNLLDYPPLMLSRSTALPKAGIIPSTVIPSKSSMSGDKLTEQLDKKPSDTDDQGGPIIVSPEEAAKAAVPAPPRVRKSLSIPGVSEGLQLGATRSNPSSVVNLDSLLMQGGLGKNIIHRDTTAFRAGVQYNTEKDNILAACYDMLKTNELRMDKVVSSLTAMESKIANLDACINILATRTSYADLGDREKLNAVLLKPTGTDASSLILHAPTVTGMQPTTRDSLYTRVMNFSIEKDDPSLCDDLRTALMSGGFETTAAVITASAFSRPGFRNRLINKLRQLPGV